MKKLNQNQKKKKKKHQYNSTVVFLLPHQKRFEKKRKIKKETQLPTNSKQ